MDYFPSVSLVVIFVILTRTEHEQVKSFVKAIGVLKSFINDPESVNVHSDVKDAVSVFQKQFHSFGEHLLAHLRNEEQSVTVVMRKYMSIDRQKDLCKKEIL